MMIRRTVDQFSRLAEKPRLTRQIFKGCVSSRGVVPHLRQLSLRYLVCSFGRESGLVRHRVKSLLQALLPHVLPDYLPLV